jgi:hypothetical protein
MSKVIYAKNVIYASHVMKCEASYTKGFIPGLGGDGEALSDNGINDEKRHLCGKGHLCAVMYACPPSAPIPGHRQSNAASDVTFAE